MESVKLQDGFVSLKTRYMEQQARAFPALGRKQAWGDRATGQQATDIDNADNVNQNEEDQFDILPVSPVEERDAKIANLKKDLDNLQKQTKEMNILQENLTKMKAENKIIRKTSFQLTQKLNLTRKTNEIKLAEIITSGETGDSPHLVTAYTATLCEDDFDLDVEKDEITPKSDLFLKVLKKDVT